jgi:hypothetical protein
MYLCLEYHEGKFNVFEVNYLDQAIAFQDRDETSLKKLIGTIFDKWNCVFWGREALSVENYIEIDQSAYFHCYDLVTYEFEFEKSNNLWEELKSFEKIDDRIHLIHQDISNRIFKYQQIATEDSLKFFELLGGDTSEVEITHKWAFEYTYLNYIEDNDLEFEEYEANNWALERKSIVQAEETGHYYCTGRISLLNNKGEELEFEFEFCEGYVDTIILTPYTLNDKEVSHGIYFI